MLNSLASFLDRRRRVALWLAVPVVTLAGAFGGPAFGLLETGTEDFDDPASESVVASAQIARATGASASPDVIALVRLGAGADTPGAQAKLDRVAAAMRDRDVAQVLRYEPGGERALVSRDGRSSYLVATFRDDIPDDEATVERIESRLEREPGVLLGGGSVAGPQVGEQVSEDIARAELIAFPLLFLLSLFAFRGVVAALLPLAVGAATILLSFLAMRLVNEVEPMSIYALNLINGLGLGLAIDYSLFMVSRYREELKRGLDVRDALRATVNTAGRTVLFSSVTVAAALAALVVFPQRFLYSMGVGGALCALFAAVVSLTLLVALLGALGHRVNALSHRRWRTAAHREASAERRGFWYRLSRTVMRRPLPIATAATAVMIALGSPAAGVDFIGVDARLLPEDKSGRIVDDALRAEFPPNRTSPVFVAARAPRSERVAVEAYARELGALDGVAVPPLAQPADGLWRIDLAARGTTFSPEARRLVEDVRAVDAPFPVRVGGQTAGFVDQHGSIRDSLPLALAILAATTIVILFLMTGSVVLPIKALVMNLLTLTAAAGLLVLGFQEGLLEGVLSFESQGGLETTQLVLLFAVAFGLSTDYGVFLLTRIKEAHDRGAPNEEAVALGLERTGRIVTFAALLFMIAIGAFATSGIIFIKQLGVGTALAVLIDATIVRALLVPSLMRLLGDRNWWAPRPLARLHARIGLSEGSAPA
ncbi:MAG TPA: MMPL family transporter [Solirubrobacteraceae bacterium]|nr:MMPL family transporter [Solirubrobacteraceae bacterium]